MATQLPKERPVIPTAQERMVAHLIVQEGKTIHDAMITAGYSANTARKGQAALSRGIRVAMIELQGKQSFAVGRELMQDPTQVEHFVMGSLFQSAVDRTSKGVAALKLMGQHRRVDMFKSDNAQNVLVIQAPADWKPEAPRDAAKDDSLPAPKDAEFPDYE